MTKTFFNKKKNFNISSQEENGRPRKPMSSNLYINNKKLLRLIVNYNLFPRIDCIPSQQFNINLCSVWSVIFFCFGIFSNC